MTWYNFGSVKFKKKKKMEDYFIGLHIAQIKIYANP